MKETIFVLVLIITVFNQSIFADEPSQPTQIIKGTILNFKTQQPVPGANVKLSDSKFGAISKGDGSFKIMNIPVGRYIVKISMIGYETQQFQIVVTSGKEEMLNVQMQESFIQLNEIKVVAEKNSFAPINESSIVSSTVFTVADVERYAGSRMDPARMAQNFAGVVGANDKRNDIVIRGGSPTELLWRIDGLDVPNPNHFATQGATGGPVSALNSNVLDNSDFLVGAWSSEYGDKMSGVFDLKTRKGNNEKYEYLGQFGFNGFEFGAEGPLPGKQNSFIANYRYSFLDLMEKMGIDFGFSGIPRYQDGMIKLDIHASEKHQISTTAMFGISNIEMKPTKPEDLEDEEFDTRSGTDFYILALNWQYLFSERSYGKLTLGVVNSIYKNDEDSVYANKNDELINIPYFASKSSEGYYSAKYSFHYSPNSKHFITAGLEERYRFYNLYAKDLNPNEPDPHLINETGNSNQVLSYLNWNWRIVESFTSDIGVFAQYLGISDKISIEPRFAALWKFLPLHSLTFGFGVHRQSLPLITYFSDEGNQKLDFMQSLHYVAGYSCQLSDDAMIKIETYYKEISKVPIEKNDLNYWSFLNSGANFGIVGSMGKELISTGSGRTYGVDISIFKNFSNHYYVTLTGSYIRQQYKGSDEIMRFGAFDNIFVANLLSGYEWIINPIFTVELSCKYTIAGGSPYIPINLESSIASNDTEYDKINAYSLRKPIYSRFDTKVDLRYNFNKCSVISYLSIENLFNTENVYKYSYNRINKSIEPSSQLGFFFVGGIRVEF